MATLLVNSKMNPALGRRIEASVTGRLSQHTESHSSARWVSRVRLVVVLGLLALTVPIYLSVRREHAEFQQARETLLAQWNTPAASLVQRDRGAATARVSAPK